MANRKMRVPSIEEYKEIINTMQKGFEGCRPNNRVAFILQLQATSCLRIGDVLRMTPNSIEKTEEGYRLNIVEEKTNKSREFAIDTETALKIKEYALENNIKSDERLFPISERAVQKHLAKVCDFLEFDDINTHSFRKFGATNIYNQTKDVKVVQEVLQHSSVAITERYIGIAKETVNKALKNNCLFI